MLIKRFKDTIARFENSINRDNILVIEINPMILGTCSIADLARQTFGQDDILIKSSLSTEAGSIRILDDTFIVHQVPLMTDEEHVIKDIIQ